MLNAYFNVNHHIYYYYKVLNHQFEYLNKYLKKKFLHQRIFKKRKKFLHQRISVFLILHCSITFQNFVYIIM